MKAETKHTPGPWTYTPQSDSRKRGYVRCNRSKAWNSEGVAVCRVTSTGIGHYETEANARLIAAAPEMLAALEHVELGVFGSMLPGSDIEICTRAARLAVQSAISKAKGNA